MQKVNTPLPGRRTTHTTRLKLHVHFGGVGTTVKYGDDKLLVGLVKFVSRNEWKIMNEDAMDLPDGGGHFLLSCDSCDKFVTSYVAGQLAHQHFIVTIMSTSSSIPKAVLYYDARSTWSLAGVLCSQCSIKY